MTLIREPVERQDAAVPRAARPVLKWAGGKRQLLPQLLAAVPARVERYIEPMIGGGALFFALAPTRAVVADRNPELVNFYRVLQADPAALIAAAARWPVTEESFYAVRALAFEDLPPAVAAARTLFLNRTCFNGLYRVNRRGGFNVPWGRHRNPVIVDPAVIEAASAALAGVPILEGDYAATCRAEARAGDLVFLDPPYLPISIYSDFKRYTKEQFGEDDHRIMRKLVEELRARGCTTIITNSNHPLMHELYRGFAIEVLATRRNINARGGGRTGEDIIITVPPA